MSHAPSTFSLKALNNNLRENINELRDLIQWPKHTTNYDSTIQNPANSSDTSYSTDRKSDISKTLSSHKEHAIQISYASRAIETITKDNPLIGTELESSFDSYWIECKGDNILNNNSNVRRKLARRILELNCYENVTTMDIKKPTITNIEHHPCDQNTPSIHTESSAQSNLYNPHPAQSTTVIANDTTPGPPKNLFSLLRRLQGRELQLLDFHRDTTEFELFWELFEELVHNQPYPKPEKLSVLSCCKDDAARTLRMILPKDDSYDLTV